MAQIPCGTIDTYFRLGSYVSTFLERTRANIEPDEEAGGGIFSRGFRRTSKWHLGYYGGCLVVPALQ